MPPQYVRPYVKTNKHDAADAEACCEAVQRPGMRFVPAKGEDQQAMLVLHRVREQLLKQRTATINALRSHLAEFGIVAARRQSGLRELLAVVADVEDRRIPPLTRAAGELDCPPARSRAEDGGARPPLGRGHPRWGRLRTSHGRTRGWTGDRHSHGGCGRQCEEFQLRPAPCSVDGAGPATTLEWRQGTPARTEQAR